MAAVRNARSVTASAATVPIAAPVAKAATATADPARIEAPAKTAHPAANAKTHKDY